MENAIFIQPSIKMMYISQLTIQMNERTKRFEPIV